MLDFPSSPTTGQLYTPQQGPTYAWDGARWAQSSGWVTVDRSLSALSGLPSYGWPLPAAYRAFRLQIEGLWMSADNNMFVAVSLDGGATYRTGASDYGYVGEAAFGDGLNSILRVGSAAADRIVLNSGAPIAVGALPSKVVMTIDAGSTGIYGCALIASSLYLRDKANSDLRLAAYCTVPGRWTNVAIYPSAGTFDLLSWELVGLL